MTDFRIFTEGKSDVVFLRDYIESIFGIKLPNNKFDVLGSWSGYKQGGSIYPNIELSLSNKEEIILVLEADVNFEQRQAEVMDDFKRFGIPIHLFLFPGNNQVGNREDLLTVIASDRKLISCFLSYEQCVKDYNLHLEKSRIFAYLDVLLPSVSKTENNDMRKDEKRDYKMPDHWDLHHAYLQPLHDFLSPFFIETT